MGEIRITGPGKTRGYPYPVCKKEELYHGLSACTEESPLAETHGLSPGTGKPWYNYPKVLKYWDT